MSKSRRDLLVGGLGSMTSRLIWLLAVPVVARLYSPSDVGSWPLVTAVAAIVAVLGTLRLDVAITITHYTPRAQTLVFFTSALTLSVAMAIAFLIAFFPTISSQVVGVEGGGPILYACPLFIVFTNLTVILQAWLLRSKSIAAITIANASTPLVTVGALIGFGFAFGANAGSFVAAYLCGLMAPFAAMFYAAMRTGLFKRPISLSVGSIWSSIRIYKAYPIYSVPLSLVAVGSERLVQLWMASAYSLEALGVLFLVRQILSSPISALTTPLQQVVFANLARIPNPAQRIAFVLPILETAMALAGIAIGLGWVLVPIIIPVLLGDRFAMAADYSHWLVLGMALLLVSTWIDRLYDVARRVALSTYTNMAYYGLVVASVAVAYVMKLPVDDFVALYSLALFIGNAVFILVALKSASFSGRDIGLAFVWLFAAGAASLGVAATTNLQFGGLVAIAASAVIAGPIGAALVVRLLRAM
ncbi:lipopolysaccharide biosynthesis protein [Devosia sp.]|uniref:lipopolysaccharide biosynthesis protein n=1 Tax=Devosia sp. TaxID=1871048 RepID=UPI003F6E60B9